MYSWLDEEDSEEVDTEPTKSHTAPKIYDLRTPLKKSKGLDETEIVFLTDSSLDLNSKKTELGKLMDTSSFQTMTLMEVLLEADNTRAKCYIYIYIYISGELHCYKNDSNI